MKKNLYELYKGNTRQTGSAIQIGKNSKGLNLQIAKQDGTQERNSFQWRDFSQSSTLKIEELTLLLSKYKSLKTKEFEFLNDLKCVFVHERSTSPKTLIFEYEELPIKSNRIIFKITIIGNDNKTVEFIFNKDEYEAFFLMIENEIKNKLGNNLIDSTLVNRSCKNDPHGVDGCRTIRSIYLPVLNIGETIVGIKNIKLKIVDKYFDAAESKPVYFVTEVK